MTREEFEAHLLLMGFRKERNANPVWIWVFRYGDTRMNVFTRPPETYKATTECACYLPLSKKLGSNGNRYEAPELHNLLELIISDMEKINDQR